MLMYFIFVLYSGFNNYKVRKNYEESDTNPTSYLYFK